MTGHFPLCTVELLDAPFRTFTVLREPVERTLSFLRHHREMTPEDADRSLEEIYDDPVRFELLHDHMVKMLSLTRRRDDRRRADPGRVRPRPASTGRRAGLDAIDVVGFQEDFDGFCAELDPRFGWDLGDPVFMNRTEPGRGRPTALRDRIARDNALDIELYEYARAGAGRAA